MKSPCEQSFMCHRDQACPDTLCPEHPISLQMLRRPGFLHTASGGHEVSNEISVRIDAPDATTRSDSIALPILVAAIAAAMLVAAGVFEFPIPFVR